MKPLYGAPAAKELVAACVHVIHRYFIWIIVASYVVATVLPGFGLWLRHVKLGSVDLWHRRVDFTLPAILLASLLFNAGLALKTAELNPLLGKPWILLGGVLGNLATPLGFIVAISFAMRFWHNPEEVQPILVGLALVASMPIAGASTAWSQNAGGNLALSLGLVLGTTLLSPLLTPAALHAVGFVTTGDYSEDLHELASDGAIDFLGIWVIAPSLLGLLAGRVIGEHRITLAMPLLKLLNYLILVLLNYANASLTLPQILAEPDIDFLAMMLSVVVSLCLTAFVGGYVLSHVFRLDRKATISLTFGLGMNNNGTGLVLAALVLADHPQVMLPIIFYNLVQHLVASWVDLAVFRL